MSYRLEKGELTEAPRPGLARGRARSCREFSSLGTGSVRDLNSDMPWPGAGGGAPLLGGSRDLGCVARKIQRIGVPLVCLRGGVPEASVL